MLFSSLVFLFYFLPIIIGCYYLTPSKYRNALLLAFSLLFYSWGGTGLTALLICSVTINYFIAKQITRQTIRSKTWFIVGVVFNIGLLVYFKYMNFFIENIGLLFGKDVSNISKIGLPLGISFYTFHQLSMLRDIYLNPLIYKVRYSTTLLYVTFFPQLVAGPIVRYKDIIHQIESRTETVERFTSGLKRFIIGLFKKVVLANTFALLANEIIDKQFEHLSSSAAWLGIIAYTLQIYFDFSGYSDMAIGLARLFGFELLENFNFPYLSKSIKEFWRRWHISLSTWFRDYVYIPLGGNKVGPYRIYFNLMVVFTLTGFWHGASWSFLFWGIFHGCFLMLERLGFEKILEKLPSLIRWSYTMFIVMIGWVYFRIEDFQQATTYIGKLFLSDAQGKSFNYFLDNENTLILLLGILLSVLHWFNLVEWFEKRIKSIFPFYLFVRNLILIILFAYCTMVLTSSSYNPFIYFNF